MKPKLPITAIIPAAGAPTNQIVAHTNLPDTMLPINGKPVIGYILDNLLSRSVTKAVIVISDSDTHTEQYVTKKFGSKIDLSIIRNDAPERGLGYTVHTALQNIDDAAGVLLYLGDTIYHGPLALESDFVAVADSYERSDKWCFIENTEPKQMFINKPSEYHGPGAPLVGIYFFQNSDALKVATNTCAAEMTTFELHHALEKYPATFNIIPAEGWYDCGNIENYYQAKTDFLKTRSFNTVSYNDLYGSITKTGTNTKKLLDEINWYRNIPQELKIFSPRLLDYQFSDERVSYTLEYYGYQSLADYFVFNHFDDKVWKLVIERIFEITDLFAKYTTKLPFSFFDEMYHQKTRGRLDIVSHDAYWKTLLSQPTVEINGKTYKGWSQYAEMLPDITNNLYQYSRPSFLHGDLCLSNILFDPHNRIFKFIDPRGNFGATSVYGDLNYDIAKLRHSFSGRYDFIVSDLFSVSETNGSFSFETFHDQDHLRIANHFDEALIRHGYDLALIQQIEALLFLSMIPLHSDSFARQQAMFINGILLLNQQAL